MIAVMRWIVVSLLAAACSGDDGIRVLPADAAMVDAWLGACDPLTQEPCADGYRCAWIFDSFDTPSGHTACVGDGTSQIGAPCSYGGVGTPDNCVRGSVCDTYSDALAVYGRCRALCSLTATTSGCGASSNCSAQAAYFPSDNFTNAAGLCKPGCDPLVDNDFDGHGPNIRTGTVCEFPEAGCYGFPSSGTPPVTLFTCQHDGTYIFNYTRAHRDVLSGQAYLNSCSQGYLPLLVESTGSTTIICVAMCKPANCYSGNCGTNDEDRLGIAPHRCNDTDRLGSFDTSPGGEHCQFLWRREIDPASATNAFLRSDFSDAVGVCYDHSKYQYDSTGDNVPDMPLPACAALQDGFGTGTDRSDPLTYFGAADLGCVDSTRLPVMANGKRRAPQLRPLDDMRVPYATAR